MPLSQQRRRKDCDGGGGGHCNNYRMLLPLLLPHIATSITNATLDLWITTMRCLQNVICPTLFRQCYCPSDYSHYITDDQRVESLMVVSLFCFSPRITATPPSYNYNHPDPIVLEIRPE
ncbi:unnamed protein product [Cercopithifilaria johnstoni]|uniref:Uncharacterized protein n=1 Tax=Cercopithifilaria johnstoni TaxID=2874296 RepID=A0A8J2MEL2_9BILA|nr:unnamed protein product [Cercopithifilaria johnstoni]